MAATSDGHIITGGYDKTIKVWSGARWEHSIFANWERDSTGRNAVHGGPVLALWPMSDGFLSGSVDGLVKLWTLDGALERTFQAGGEVLCAAVLPDGDHFVVGVSVGEAMNAILLYHFDRTLVHAFRAGEDEAAASMLAVTPDGQHIISDSHIKGEGFYVEGEAADFSVKVWSVASKSLVSTCIGHTGLGVHAVAVMPDGQRILSGGDDETVRVWLLNGTLENTFELHEHYVMALVALPDNQHALSGFHDSTVKLFNVNDGAVLRTFTHNTDPVTSLALLPDGLRFVSGSNDKTARIVMHGLAP